MGLAPPNLADLVACLMLPQERCSQETSVLNCCQKYVGFFIFS